MAARPLAFVFSLLILACPSGGAEETGAASMSTLGFFAPKVDLSQLRFVHLWRSGLYVELANEQSMMLDDFLAAFPEVTSESHTVYLDKSKRLTAKQNKYLRSRLPESIGERYAVYFPQLGKVGMYRLAGFYPKPTGDGGLRGLLGVLEPTKGAVQPILPDDDVWREFTALAFPCSVVPREPKAMDEAVTDPPTLARVAKALQRFDEFRDQNVYECRRIFIEYPDRYGYLAKVRGSVTYVPRNESGKSLPDQAETYQPSYLFCLVDYDGILELAPFAQDGTIEYEKFGGLMIEAGGTPACDTTPGNTKVYVLPDLDGDRVCEILVDTTVTQLFRITQCFDSERHDFRRRLTLTQSSYFGP